MSTRSKGSFRYLAPVMLCLLDTYAPLPADRKDIVLETKCENGSKDINGLDSLYCSFKDDEKFNVELERVTVADEKAPDPDDIDKIVNVVINKATANTVIVFNCQMGKGRTTEGMIMACLIQQKLQYSKADQKEDDEDGNGNAAPKKEDRWPLCKHPECEEYESFKKKMKESEEEMAKKGSSLSIETMKAGMFTLIERLMNILKNEYKLDADKIKRETDDIIDRTAHLQVWCFVEILTHKPWCQFHCHRI